MQTMRTCRQSAGSNRARAASKDINTLQAAENRAPQGLWSDGTTMWVADGDDKKLYAYLLKYSP